MNYHKRRNEKLYPLVWWNIFWIEDNFRSSDSSVLNDDEFRGSIVFVIWPGGWISLQTMINHLESWNIIRLYLKCVLN